MKYSLVSISWAASTTSAHTSSSFVTYIHSDQSNRFVTVSPIYTPVADGKQDNIYITRSYDATSHFETVVEDVQDVFKRVMGKDLELKKRETDSEQ
jgi:RAB protein geranylgeranyltransferase component A